MKQLSIDLIIKGIEQKEEININFNFLSMEDNLLFKEFIIKKAKKKLIKEKKESLELSLKNSLKLPSEKDKIELNALKKEWKQVKFLKFNLNQRQRLMRMKRKLGFFNDNQEEMKEAINIFNYFDKI